MHTQSTRRTILASFSSLAAAAFSGSALANTAPTNDPVHLAIARHRDAFARRAAANDAHRAAAEALREQAEFIAQERTIERSMFLTAHPEYASHSAFQQQDDAVFCAYRDDAVRHLELTSTEWQAIELKLKEAADAEDEAVQALTALKPDTAYGKDTLDRYLASRQTLAAAA